MNSWKLRIAAACGTVASGAATQGTMARGALARRRLMSLALLCLLALLTVADMRPAVAQALPSPRTGGKNGGPLAILFVFQTDNISPLLDAGVAKRLTDQGFVFQAVSDREPLTAEYLHQFDTVVCVGLDDYYGGRYYGPNGLSLLNTEKTVKLLQEYVGAGGGLVVVPIMAQAGSQVAGVLDSLLAEWKMRIGWENVRDDAHPVNDPQNPTQPIEYAWTHAVVAGPLTQGVSALAYPTGVMRWDDAYATNPLLPGDAAWQVLARGEPGSGGYRSVGSRSWIAGEAGAAPALAAVRQAGKGRVGVVGIGGYFLLTHAFADKDEAGKRLLALGENTTGPLEGIAYEKGDGKTASNWGVLLSNMLRWTSATGVAEGFGGAAPWTGKGFTVEWSGAEPPAFAMVDWNKQTLPPTWAHHAPNLSYWGGNAFFDEIPDPLVVAPQKMNKILIGAHSTFSDGKGSVAQWAAAAKAAGFCALVFTEKFEDFKPQDWPRYVQECKDATSPDFAVLQGLDLADSYGNRFLLMGSGNFPAPNLLTQGGKALLETARLSLGFSQHISAIARPGADKGLPTELYRHFQAIPVYTYGEEKGKYQVVDDGLAAYRWQLDNASNPIPIIVHELHDPAEVQSHGTQGFQLVVPSQNAVDAIRYFRYGMDHFFEDPQRYFVTEGPLITGWSIFNKDIGAAELNRDHFRATVGAATTYTKSVIKEAVLYDRGAVVRRWTPNQSTFSTLVDGSHGYQRYYMLEVTDSQGRRAISPHLRTVARGYYTRCGDRQNWFGAAGSYTGIWPSGRHGINYVDPIFNVGPDSETFTAGKGHPLVTKLSFPFASNALTLTNMVVDSAYSDPIAYYGMDAWRLHNVQPSSTYQLTARVSQWNDVETGIEDYRGAVAKLTQVDSVLQSRIAAQPTTALFPVINTVPKDAAYVYSQGGKRIEGKLDGNAQTLVDLPAGAGVGDLLLLQPLTVAGNGQLGWRAAAGATIAAGTQWHSSYLYIPAAWRTELGADGATPWNLQLRQGMRRAAPGVVQLTAVRGGVAGTLHHGGALEMLPLQVNGLNDGWPAALWLPQPTAYSFRGLYHPVALKGTESATFLTHIGVYHGTGYAALPAKVDTAFYVGNTLTASDPNLKLAYTTWTGESAGIEVNNPTDRAIRAHLSSPVIAGRYHVETNVTVPAGSSLRLSLPATRVAAAAFH